MSDRDMFADPTELHHRIGASGSFSLAFIAGSLKLKGADTDEVHVLARSERGDETLPLTVRRSENGLHIEVDERSFAVLRGGRKRGGHGIDFEVVAPRAARIDINAVSADVTARHLSGEQAYRTVSGDVDVDAEGGRVSVITVSGDIAVSSVGSVEAILASTSGDVELEAPTIESLSIRTVSGDAQVSGILSPAATHSVETVSGDLAVDTPGGLTIDVKRGLDIAGGGGRRLVNGDGAAQLRFRSLSGDVGLGGQRGGRATRQGPAPSGEREVAHREHSSAEGDAERQAERSAANSLAILRALELGDIDVEEASRRLEGVRSDA